MQKFAFQDFLRVIQKYRITHLQVAPPILIMLDKRSESSKFDLSSLKGILCGAAPLSRELQNTVQRKLNLNVVQAWGMTEVTCGGLYVPGGRSDDSGSVGMLVPNCECKILDDEGNTIHKVSPVSCIFEAPIFAWVIGGTSKLLGRLSMHRDGSELEMLSLSVTITFGSLTAKRN